MAVLIWWLCDSTYADLVCFAFFIVILELYSVGRKEGAGEVTMHVKGMMSLVGGLVYWCPWVISP